MRVQKLTQKSLEALGDETFKIICLRFATACGASPNLRLDLVFNDFVAAGLFEKTIQILSNGEPWRPLIHVTDMARAIEWACITENTDGFCAVNVGSDEWTFKIKELAEKISDVMGGTKVKLNKDAQHDDRSYIVDFGKFRKLAPDHQPKAIFEDAVLSLVEQLSALNYSEKNSFRGEAPYFRLKALTNNIQNHKMTEELYWK